MSLDSITNYLSCDLLENRQAQKWRTLFFLLASGFLVFAVYANTLHSPFIFDDWRHIEGNPHIRMQTLSFDGLKEAAFGSPLATRPLANVSFALNYLGQGYTVTGYHLINILIHLISGMLVFFLLEATLSTLAMRGERQNLCWLPCVAALFWLVHPLQTQSVTYIVQRMNSLSAMFYLLAFLCYVKARLSTSRNRQIGLLAGACFAWLLACASKEIALVMPLLALLYEWYFIQDLKADWLKRHWLFGTLVVLLLIVTGLVMVGGSPWHAIKASYAIRDFTMTERLLTQPRVVFFYLSLLLFPHPARLNLDHDFPISHGLFEPATTSFSLIGILLLSLLALTFSRRCRLVSFAVFWFLGNLVIESSVLGLEIIFEHRTYLPSVFPVAALVLAGSKLIRKLSDQKRKIIAVSVVLVALCGLSFFTFERNQVWQSEETLRLDCLAKSPLKPRNHAILASVYERQGAFQRAAGHYRDALLLKPENAFEIFYNLGNVLMQTGDLAEAEQSYRQALAESPEISVIRLNLGVALERQGNLAAAVDQYRELLRRDPGFARGHNNLGNVYMRMGQHEEAAGHFREALKIRPDFAAAQANLQKVQIVMKESRQ